MNPKPVRRYARPQYPTRVEIAAHPELLRWHQPPAWRRWPELTGATGLLLLADTARLQAADGSPKGSQPPGSTNAVAIVAPIFQHGAGRGADGCIVMAPPVFLSEQEALQVIREEMSAGGVQLGMQGTEVSGLIVDRLAWLTPSTSATNQPKTPAPIFEIKKETFKADAADRKKKVFVKFLGERNVSQWDRERQKEEAKSGGPSFNFSTVQHYNLPKTAAYLAERVKRQATDQLYFGTFYDPLAANLHFERSQSKGPPSREEFEALVKDAKAQSQRLLRLQVQDFLKWLQAQGAI